MNMPSSFPANLAVRERRVDVARLAVRASPAILRAWRLVSVHKWQILAIAAVITLLTTLVVFQLTPIYRATATVLVEANKNKVVSIEEVYSGVSGNREYFLTQAEFLRSRDVSLRVVRDLNLSTHRQFDPRQRGRFVAFQGWIRSFGGGSTSSAEWQEQSVENAVLAEFQSHLQVNPIRASQLINVSFESPDPKLAAQIANAVSEAYIKSELDARFRMTQTANVWLNERLSVLREKLDASEKALQQYRDEAGLVEKANGTGGANSRQLDEIQQRLIQARIARSQAEQVYGQVRGSDSDRYQVPTVFNNPSVARARELEAAAESKLSEMAQRYGAAHPLYQSAQNELNTARQFTKRQADSVIASIAKEFEVARATERALEESLNKSRGSIQDVNRKEVRLGALEREAASNRQLYQTFLARVKETSATGDFMTPVARIVDPASAPIYPDKPPKTQLVMLGLLFGLLVGTVVAFVREWLGDVIRATEDVDTKLHAALLSAVPQMTVLQAKRATSLQIEEPQSGYAEAVRTILTGIQLSTLTLPRTVVGFTSCLAGEGKSTIAISFALEQSRTKRVLLIDLDLRRPVVASRLGLPLNHPGLAEMLTGQAPSASCIQVMAGRELHVMSSGKTMQNSMDLLLSPHFPEAIRLLQSNYDMIVIDTPPMQLVSDAFLIGRVCTGMVCVVRSASTAVPVVKRNLERLATADLNLFGVVLNAHDFKKAERYYGEYQSYTTSAYGNAANAE